MTESMRGERSTIEVLRQASKNYLRKAETRKAGAREAWSRAHVGFRMFRHGKFMDIKREDTAAYWHEVNASKVDQVMSGATSLSYSEEPEADRYVKWDLEIVSGGKKIKIGARHFLGGPSYASGYIDPFQADPYVQMGGNHVYGDERFDVTRRFKDFIDDLKSQGIIDTKVKAKA